MHSEHAALCADGERGRSQWEGEPIGSFRRDLPFGIFFSGTRRLAAAPMRTVPWTNRTYMIEMSMMARFSLAPIFVAICWIFFSSVMAATASAADDVQKFVAALRESHYHDTATDYLASLEHDNQISATIQQWIPYEQGVVFVESALATHDPGIRDRQLVLAQNKLRTFLEANATHDLALQAQQQLAGVLRSRAEGLLLTSAKGSASAPQARNDAGKLFDEARGLYADVAKRLRAQLDDLPKEDSRHEDLGELWLAARYYAAQSMFDLAGTRDAAEERKKMLLEAASQCDDIYARFSKRKVGVLSKLLEGQCFQKAGDATQALAAFGDLIADLPDIEPDARQLKTVAMKHALACWLQTKDYEQAIEKAVPWAKSARGAELRDPDWLEVKFSTATALKELATKERQKSKDNPNVEKYLNLARELATEVAKARNRDLQSRGRQLLAQIGLGKGISIAKTVAFAGAEIKTFDDAFEKAKEAADEISTAQMELEYVEKDPNATKKEIDDLKKSIETNEQHSFELLKRAVELADQNTDAEKLRTTFYLLGYFHYQRGEYLDAAVFGEHVARRYPDAANARACAKVAMAAFDASFRKGQQAGEDVSFEAGKLAEMADYVARKWPDQPEAAAAFSALVALYINQGEYDKAKQTLDRISPDSPGRAEAEASLGNMLWRKYLLSMAERRRTQASGESTNAADDADASSKLDSLLQEGQAALERSVEAFRKQKDVDPKALLAALSLAQIYVHVSQPDKALKLLDDGKLGPVTLLDQQNAAAQATGIPAEIYKTAMKAYVSVDPPQIDKATAAMDALEKIYAGDDEGEAKFTQLLIAVAVDLQQQLDELKRTGKSAKQSQLSAGFEQFLRRIAQRKSGTDYKTLKWIAYTYANMAESLAAGGQPSKQAVGYFQQAAKSYGEILQRATVQPNFAPKAELSGVQFELAKAQRGAGQYDEAIDHFASMLKENPNWVSVQEEAAATYQQRGASDPKYYVLAVRGGRKGDAANIWGWGVLAKKTLPNPKFQDTFLKSRYNLALCVRLDAAAHPKAEDKTKGLKNAKENIRITQKFVPSLGGDTWKPKYEKLLRDIQQALGEPEIGLKEFEGNEGTKG
ncbi:MAG: tetratricopeptide repeat protein [Pirellulales bacterium]|nr:tetratricopeptide repeat protein [Pirellulales bacterium]